jgi:WD40 repeat protein
MSYSVLAGYRRQEFPVSRVPRGSVCRLPAQRKFLNTSPEQQESLSQRGYHLSESLMKYTSPAILCVVALLLCLVAPVTCAATPLWVQPAAPKEELSGVVITEDDSSIIAGGDHLIAISREGKKCWTAWSGSLLATSRDGRYILNSKGPVVRLISGTGTLIWEKTLDSIITDVSIAPDASAIAVTGGGQINIFTLSGESIASDRSMAINHINIMPSGEQILITTSKDVQLSDLTLVPAWSDNSSTQDFIEVTPDGSSFVTATNGRIRMYNGSGGLAWEQRLPNGSALALAYSHDGSTIVVGMDDNTVQVLNHNGALLWMANATNWITSVAVSDGGNTIVAGSRDKKVHVFNHAGTRLGIFAVKSPIDLHSVAVTGDGSLIVIVDQTAVYGLSRSSFIPQETVLGTITTPSPVLTDSPTVTTSRKLTPRILTLPTPTPTETPQAPLLPAVPVIALGLLLLCRFRKT